MANECNNMVWFYSRDKKLLQSFFNKFRACHDDLYASYIYQLFLAHGYKEAELQELDRGDMIVDCDGIISKQDSFYFFQAETETAWTPNVESLQKLLCKRYADKIKLIYFADASEDGIYITNDYNGVFVNEQYKLDYAENGESTVEYFKTYDDLMEYIRYFLSKTVSNLDDFPTMERKIMRNLKADAYCYITHVKYDYELKERSAA